MGLPEDGGYSVVQTVVFVVITSRVVVVMVWVEVPPFSSWLQNDNAWEVCPTKPSSPHLETSQMLTEYSYRRASHHDWADHWGIARRIRRGFQL